MIVIAQCVDRKRDKQLPAKDLYKGQYFNAQRRYAEKADNWYILSAKHGLLNPNTEIQPYDRYIDEGVPEPGKRTYERILPNIEDTVQLICGEKYCRELEPHLDEYNIKYSKPFSGLRIGTRTKKMNNEARKQENNTLDRYA